VPVAIAIAAATSGVLPVFLTGAMGVQLRRALHFSDLGLGLAVASFFAASALCSVSFGVLAEHRGPVAVMRLAVVTSIASLLALGLGVMSLATLCVALALGGVANGATQPAVNLFLSRRGPRERQGLAFGIKQAGIPTATLLSGLAVPSLALTLGWRAAYLAGVLVAVCVAAVLWFQRDAVSEARNYTPARRPTRAGASPVAAGAGELLPRQRGPFRRQPGDAGAASARRRRPRGPVLPLVVLACGMALAVSAANSLGSFAVPSAVDHGVAPGLAGLLASLGSVFGFSARVGLGWRADAERAEAPASPVARRAFLARRHLATVAGALALGTLGYLALATGDHALLVPGVVLAFGAGWGWNGLFNLAVVRAYADAPARATGITQVGTYIGGMAGPLGFGAVASGVSYALAWSLCAAFALGGAALFLTGRSLLRRHPIWEGAGTSRS
jgi:MFS family permease